MISVLINTEKDFGVSSQKIRKVVKRFLGGKGIYKAQVSVALVGAGTIRNLNKNYRGLDKATSVLAFPQEGQVKFPPVDSGEEILGDVVICPTVADQKNLSLEFLLKHGITNLLSKVSTAKNL
jgi:rRNA maturation RNase YbeY